MVKVNQQQAQKLLLQADIFVLPSYNEGLPMAILEAMAHKLPIISTDVGSITDAVQHNKNGLVIKSGDVESNKNNKNIIIK